MLDQILAKIEAVFLCHHGQGNVNLSTVLQKTLDYKSRLYIVSSNVIQK